VQLDEDGDRMMKKCMDTTLPLDTRLDMLIKSLEEYKCTLALLLEEKERHEIFIAEFQKKSDKEYYAEQYWEMREEELKQFEEEFKKQFTDLNKEQLVELTEGLEKYFMEK